MGGGNRRDAEHLQVSKAAICSTEQQTLSLQQEGRKGLIPEVVLYPPHEHPDIRFTELTCKHTPYTNVCKTF